MKPPRIPNQEQSPKSFGFLKLAAWLLLIAVVAITLVPAEFRPTTPLPLKAERAFGFATLTFVFTLAYPRRWLLILLGTGAGAVGLELLQFAVPSRDPSPIDAAVKVIGAVLGVIAATIARRIGAAAANRWRS
jgi:hypothetical protein